MSVQTMFQYAAVQEETSTQPYLNFLYPVTNKIASVVLPIFNVVTPCYLFILRPNIFSLCFWGAAIIPIQINNIWQSTFECIEGISRGLLGDSRHEGLIAPIEPFIKKFGSIWKENQYLALEICACLLGAATPQRYAIATAVYAIHIGHSFYEAPKLLNITKLIPAKIISKLEYSFEFSNHIVTKYTPISLTQLTEAISLFSIKFIQILCVLTLPSTFPNLLVPSFSIGAFIFPSFVNEMDLRISEIWKNNKICFIVIGTCMFYLARPSFLMMTTVLYFSSLGAQLYSNSLKKETPENPTYPNIYPPIRYPTVTNPSYPFDNKFHPLTLRILEIVVTCLLFKSDPAVFSLFFAYGALIKPHQADFLLKVNRAIEGISSLVLGDVRHKSMKSKLEHLVNPFEPFIEKVAHIWQENQHWIIGTFAGLLCLTTPYRWTIATVIYAVHLGSRFSVTPQLPKRLSFNLKEQIGPEKETKSIFRIVHKIFQFLEEIFTHNISIKVIQVASITILSNTLPNLFGPSLILGALIFPHHIDKISTRISLLWEKNKVLFLLINICLFFYTLPAYLLMSTLLYSSFLGRRLYYDRGNAQKLLAS